MFNSLFIKEIVFETGFKCLNTKHGLRDTLALLLYGSSHFASSLSQQTGHRNLRSGKQYQHIQELERLFQQQNLLVSVADLVCD